MDAPRTTDQVGRRTEAAVASALASKGLEVFLPACGNTNNAPTTYDGQVEEFGVYSPDLNRVYLVPIGEAPSRACFLRLEPPRNGQRRHVRWAEDFELGRPG